MRSDTKANSQSSPRPSSSATSHHSGRCSKQSFIRSNDLQQFEHQTLMTPQGLKTVRIYSASAGERNCMTKYSTRPRTAIGIMNSGDKGKQSAGGERLLQRASSTNELHHNNIHLKTDNDRPKTASSSIASSISSHQSSSRRQIILNSRHPMCSPVNLYLQDGIRSEARKQRPNSVPYDCDECSSEEQFNNIERKKRSRSADVVQRFGTRIQCPKFVEGNSFLTHDELDIGQKQYIWGMARVYSVNQLKALRQRHYQSILNYEYIKRVMTRGVIENDRVKLQKEYMEYQKVINRFGKGSTKLRHGSAYNRPHSHAKKHRITGWTTEITDESSKSDGNVEFISSNDITDESSKSDENEEYMSSNDDSFIFSDKDSVATDEDKPVLLQEKLCSNRDYANKRPKSSKYKIRKPQVALSPEGETEMLTEDLKVEETLHRDVHEKLNLADKDENFV